MRLSIILLACVMPLASPHTSSAEYIEITQPVDIETYRPCAPSDIEWESDIDPSERDVLDISWRVRWGEWHSVGLSSNDGVEYWSDAPCWENSPQPNVYELRIVYTADPSVYDIIVFATAWPVLPGPFAISIDFSGSAVNYEDIVSRADPVQYTTVDAYVVLVGASTPPTEGFVSVSFALDVGPPEVLVAPSFDAMLPGGFEGGYWDTGIILAASECMGTPGDVVYVGVLTFFYMGGEGDILIQDHPNFPRWVTDCHDPPDVFEYVVGSHGGVAKDPSASPVEATSWGAIKALYR